MNTLGFMPDELKSLAIQFETLFVLAGAGRIERENDPEESSGPLFWLGGRSQGNLAGVHTKVADDVGRELLALAETEPPLYHKGSYPVHYERYLTLLSKHGPTPKRHLPSVSLGLTYELPHAFEQTSPIPLVNSEGELGRQLETKLATEGIPPELRALGFERIEDFWKPWCVALHEGEIASVAFAARLSSRGAELGLATVKSLRGRGYAAAATRGWSSLPSLQSRALFYSADQSNLSSQRVIERLGLRLLGAYLRLT